MKEATDDVFARPARVWLRGAALGAMAAAAFAFSGAAAPQDCGDGPDGFADWLARFKQEAAAAGVSPSVIETALGEVAYDEEVLAHDRRQHGFGKNFDDFAGKRVTANRVKKGRSLLIRYAEAFDAIERRYGVPGPVLVAIWGLESEFGAGVGDVPTFTALATLAYDCRRPERFRAELVAALKIVERGDLDPARMRGAWAGELGQTQFLPSTYLKYAVAIAGAGGADLIDNAEDALASTANFLKAKGWKRGQGWHEGEPNYAALLQWNAAPVYAKTIAYFADRLAGQEEEEEGAP